MNYSLEESPLTRTDLTKDKMNKWLDAQRNGGTSEVDVYGKASNKQMKELDNVRKLSKELQDNLQVSLDFLCCFSLYPAHNRIDKQ